MSRILAIDPGDARIGLAISDETGIIARPLRVIEHISRGQDAETILQIARENSAREIVVGVAYNPDGNTGPQARKALRLAQALRQAGTEVIHVWDESGSTRVAQQISHSPKDLDARAAAVILQDFLDAKTG
jgi:putative Holliday junction resolvase